MEKRLAIRVGGERLERFRGRTSKEERSERKARYRWLTLVRMEDSRGEVRVTPRRGWPVEATRCACDALSVTAWDLIMGDRFAERLFHPLILDSPPLPASIFILYLFSLSTPKYRKRSNGRSKVPPVR